MTTKRQLEAREREILDELNRRKTPSERQADMATRGDEQDDADTRSASQRQAEMATRRDDQDDEAPKRRFVRGSGATLRQIRMAAAFAARRGDDDV